LKIGCPDFSTPKSIFCRSFFSARLIDLYPIPINHLPIPTSDVGLAACVPREAPAAPSRAAAGGGAGACEPTLGGAAVGAGPGVAAGVVAAKGGWPPDSAPRRACDSAARRVAAAAAVFFYGVNAEHFFSEHRHQCAPGEI